MFDWVTNEVEQLKSWGALEMDDDSCTSGNEKVGKVLDGTGSWDVNCEEIVNICEMVCGWERVSDTWSEILCDS